MNHRPMLIACLLATSGLATPALTARTETKPHIEKTTDISDNPQVKAAQKVRDDAEKTLESAKAGNDKAAIDTAQKALDDAETKLKSARKEAESAEKKPKSKKH